MMTKERIAICFVISLFFLSIGTASSAEITVNNIYILTTIYLFLGSLHWESRLVSQFGDEYREYQKRVHRIIPHSGRY